MVITMSDGERTIVLGAVEVVEPESKNPYKSREIGTNFRRFTEEIKPVT